MGGSLSSRGHLSPEDLAFLRDPANKDIVDSLKGKVHSSYLQSDGEHSLANAPRKRHHEAIELAIANRKGLIKGRDFFQDAARSRAEQLPLILQQLQMQQQPDLQGPQLNAFGFNQPPQLQGFQGAQPQLGGLQGNLLGGLGTFGQQQIAAGQQHNPTILKAK